MAHPGDPLGGKPPEQGAAGIVPSLRLAVLPGGGVGGGDNPAAQMVSQQLTAVANAQNGHAQREDGRVYLRRAGLIDAAGTAGKDDSDGIFRLNLPQGSGIGQDLAVDAALADAAGDQLIVLPAEVQNDDFLHRSVLPVPKNDVTRLGAFNNGQGLEVVSGGPETVTAALKALFNGAADAHQLGAGGVHDLAQTAHGHQRGLGQGSEMG